MLHAYAGDISPGGDGDQRESSLCVHPALFYAPGRETDGVTSEGSPAPGSYGFSCLDGMGRVGESRGGENGN